AQLEAWNARDKVAFFGCYRDIAPQGLVIDYVGQPQRDPWEILETMWTQQNDKIEVLVKKKIVNGTEAACFHLNKFRDAEGGIDTIETYAFDNGRLHVRYFIDQAAPHG